MTDFQNLTKFFQWHTQQQIGNKTITKDSTISILQYSYNCTTL